MHRGFNGSDQSIIKRSLWLGGVLLVQVSIWTTLAYAQSLTNTVKAFGLIGTWADDCNQNPSPANQHAIFSITTGGAIQLRDDFGPDYEDMVYSIVDAKRIGQFRMSMRQLLMNDDRIALDTVLLKTKDKIRVWSSRGTDGTVLVDDGSMPVANGQETGWLVRCDFRRAGDPGSGADRRKTPKG
jgi:hypothetical protein